MNAYYLSKHVHFCDFGDRVVFLDLKADEYSFLNGSAAKAFQSLSMPPMAPSPGLGPQLVRQATDCGHNDLADALSDVISAGILTQDARLGRPIAPDPISPATSTLIDVEDEDMPGRLRPHHITAFFASTATAAARLRWGKIEKTVDAIRSRKAKHKSGRSAFDAEKCRDLVGCYMKMRMLFPKNYLCIFDSLALVEFLARYNVWPNWIFGVQLDPWYAHSWVQHDGMVLNDDLERVQVYEPILAV